MMERKKRERLEGETMEEYVKRIANRKGSKNKRKPNILLKDVYSKCSEKDNMAYKDWSNLINLFLKAIHDIVVQGKDVPLPFLGTLTFAERKKSGIVLNKNAKTEKGKFVDKRSIDFNKLLRNQYTQDEFAENPKNSSVLIRFYLHNGKKPRIFYFHPQKYLVRETKNNLFGCKYKLHEYK